MEKEKGQTKYLLKTIWSLLQCSKKTFVMLSAGVIVASVTTFFRPQIISRLTDEGLVARKFHIVLLWCGVLAGVSILEYGNELLQIKIFTEVSNQFLQNLFAKALGKILRAPYSYTQSRASAELFSTISNDINRISLLLDRNSLMLVRLGFQIVGGIIGLILLEWRVALFVLMIIPLKQFVVWKMSKKKTVLTGSYIEEWQKFSEWFGDQINGVVEIKLWNLYGKKYKEFIDEYKNIPQLNQQLEICDGQQDVVSQGVSLFLEVLVYILCGYLLCKNQMSIGNVLAFLSYVMYVTSPIDVFTSIPYIWAQIKPSAKRYVEIIEWPEEMFGIGNISQTYQSELVFRNVTFGYDDQKMILENINFKVKKGEKIAIIGGNGEGKTTLINLMLGIISPISGEIYIDGVSIADIGVKNWREHFALVGQKPYLFQGSVKSNIDLYDDMTMEQIKIFARQYGLDMKIGNWEDGYAYQITDNGINLSGGEKQKIAFLRAVLKKAEIVILDEALSNCDEKSRKNIRRIVMDETFDKTVIIVSHYKEDLEGLQKVYEIKDKTLRCKL